MERQFMNLNIRYDFPVWDYRVPTICAKMPGYIKGTNFWFSKNLDEKHLSCTVEPAGFVIGGLMENEEWEIWSKQFKVVATEILGYKIGEIETGEVGHDFIWTNPKMKVLEDFREILNSQNLQN